ncbi:MAG: tRNA 2-selenouridine(34) synthase MnmH [Synechococcales cyanobacterium K44_A2020_017]|nr:tRNA 2-selenouridine(34) synthase MnmH [Synechococcales cyanobacterium K32_A2020_035]MBF2093927.1 tRNA 2-selenouridine(34) synthase MnmH [Synechococcales cyanobacterium K44_A2020_017]
MPHCLDVHAFLHAPGPILDVRSPAEYAQGHIPGAASLPLFSNEERAQVGICYKHQGRDAAVELGLAIAGPKLAALVATAKQLAPDRMVRVHCWRGGMRSGSVAWLLETAGFQVATLALGYKGFRRWAQTYCATTRPMILLGGMTGTGKTDSLQAIARRGEPVLDLEHLASHRGSSFGSLGLPAQPSNEQFENRLAIALEQLPLDRPIWIEAESRRIGLCRIPNDLFEQMLRAPMLQVERSRDERVAILVAVYQVAPIADLIAATERLRKRLGGQRTQAAVAHLQGDRLPEACEVILDYYDRTYAHALKRHLGPVYTVDVTGLSTDASAALMLDVASTL